MRTPVLALALGAASLAGAAPPFEARVQVFQPACSRVPREDVADALRQASGLLQGRCGIGLSLTAWTRLPLDHVLCSLPLDAQPRARILKSASAGLKAAQPRSLALILLPDSADERLSWALVDVSRARACDSPQEARYLPRFGSFFFTDLSWSLGPDVDGLGRPALLFAHEVLHSLTHRGHPSQAPPGSVMADHVADLGPAIGADWCECARKSPYIFRR